MIKVKIQNPITDRNEPTFRPLFFVKDMLRDYSIDITDSDDYDFLFVGMHDFLNKKIPLKESIEYGLENLSKISGDYFLFDGSDSTSLMGAYEVFEQSNAIYLMKNQNVMIKILICVLYFKLNMIILKARRLEMILFIQSIEMDYGTD